MLTFAVIANIYSNNNLYVPWGILVIVGFRARTNRVAVGEKSQMRESATDPLESLMTLSVWQQQLLAAAIKGLRNHKRTTSKNRTRRDRRPSPTQLTRKSTRG